MLAHTAVPRSKYTPIQDLDAYSFDRASENARYMIAELTNEGDLLCNQGNPQGALDCFLKTMELMRSSQSVEIDEIAICHYKTACAYTMLNMYTDAQRHYRQARQISRRAAGANRLEMENDMELKASHKDTVGHRLFKILRSF